MEAAPSQALGRGSCSWTNLPWEQPWGPTVPPGGFGIPCTLLAPNPTFFPYCWLVEWCCFPHGPARLNTDTSLGSPCSASAGLLLEEEVLLSSRDDAEIRNCSLFSFGAGGERTLTWLCSGTKDGLEQRLLSSSTEG